MTLSDRGRIQLTDPEADLLVLEVPNEVINGFDVADFEEVIGSSKEDFKRMANSLRSASKGGEISLDFQQAQVLRNALAVVLRELGTDEFQTRTGCDFSAGHDVLRNLSDFVSPTKPKASN